VYGALVQPTPTRTTTASAFMRSTYGEPRRRSTAKCFVTDASQIRRGLAAPVYFPPSTLRAITTRWICEVPS
jgi:hypothetical protein